MEAGEHVRPAARWDRFLREPRRHCSSRSTLRMIVRPPTTRRARQLSSETTQRPGASLRRRPRRDSRQGDGFNPSESSWITLCRPDPTGERRRPVPPALVGVLDYSFGNFKLPGHQPLTAASGGLAGRRPRAARRRPAGGRPPSTSRTSTPATPQAKFDDLAGADRQQPRSRPTSSRSKRCRTTTAPPTTATVDADRDLRRADRGDPGRRRPDLRVPPDRPGGRPGRRRAGRQHPGRLPVPHRPRAEPSWTGPAAAPTTATTVVSGTGRAAALLQPRPDRPDQPRLRQQPQAAGRRVHLQRRQAVRDRQPLQLQGRRPAAVRPLPAADAQSPRPSGISRPRSSTISSTRSWPLTRNAEVVVLGDLNDFEFSETLDDAQGRRAAPT